MDGVIVIDKPAGPTSHDVVDVVRGSLGIRKVGHTGTLDPVATGVLPLVLGKATRLARFISGGDKVYRATIRLGVATTTLDREGEVTSERPVDVSEAQVRDVIGSFVGTIEQIPPMYSAKKQQGKRLYELARKGVSVEREPKEVTLHAIRILSCALPDVEVEVHCSPGTYVRVLAQDVGEKLGCGAHLAGLERVQSGPFKIEDAITLDLVEKDPEAARSKVLSIGESLAGCVRIDLPKHVARMVASGHQLSVADLKLLDVPPMNRGDFVALWLDSGEVLAVASALVASNELAACRRDERALKTERVLWRL